MVGNVLIYLAVVVSPVTVAAAVLAIPKLVDAIARRRRVPMPRNPPVERVAADLRRVRRSLKRLAPDAPVLRRRATREAYDTLLVQACQAVDVPHRLDAVAGIEREVERLRLEEELCAAGICVS